MSDTILFEEIQGSGKKSLRDIMRFTAGVFLLSLLFNLSKGKGEIGTVTMLLFAGFLVSALTSVFIYIRLVTQIRTDGIYVRFFPFQSSFNRFAWEDILDVYIRNFDALTEYNGWGIRYGAWGKGYIISGNTGIQIIFRDKTRLLISTRKGEEISHILNNLHKT